MRVHTLGRCVRGGSIAVGLLFSAAVTLGAQERGELNKKLASLERELQSVKEELKDAEQQEGFLSLLGERFNMGGEIEIEFIDLQSETDQVGGVTVIRREENTPFLRVDKVRLSPEISLTGKDDPISVVAAGDLDFLVREQSSVRARVKEFHVTFEGRHTPWAESRLRVGLEDPFMRPPHDTEFWPLAATAFWRREALGFFLRTRLGDRAKWYGRFGIEASLTNGYRLEDREPGEGEFDIISRDARISGQAELRQYGVGLSWERRWFDNAEYVLLKDVLEFDRAETEGAVFYYNDSMASDDRGYIQDIVGGPGKLLNSLGQLSIRGREMWGGNLIAEVGNLSFVAHYIESRDGRLNRKAGYLEGAWRVRFKPSLLWGEYLRSVKPIVRYGFLNTNLPRSPFDTRTWDRTRWTLALLTELRKNVNLKIEYAFNGEKIGGVDPKDPNTDEFLLQLEIFF